MTSLALSCLPMTKWAKFTHLSQTKGFSNGWTPVKVTKCVTKCVCLVHLMPGWYGVCIGVELWVNLLPLNAWWEWRRASKSWVECRIIPEVSAELPLGSWMAAYCKLWFLTFGEWRTRIKHSLSLTGETVRLSLLCSIGIFCRQRNGGILHWGGANFKILYEVMRRTSCLTWRPELSKSFRGWLYILKPFRWFLLDWLLHL